MAAHAEQAVHADLGEVHAHVRRVEHIIGRTQEVGEGVPVRR